MMWGSGMMGNWGSWGALGWLGGITGFLFMAAIWVGIIALIYYGIRALARSGERGSRERTPLEIARERYARGEITREQFEQLKRDVG